jgi:hypothetical protein
VRILRSGANTLLHFFTTALSAIELIETKPVDFSKYFNVPARVGSLLVERHNRFLAADESGGQYLERLRDVTVARIYKACQEAGEQQIVDPGELAGGQQRPLLACLVREKAFVYNPRGKQLVRRKDVRDWELGRAKVGPNELYPQDYIIINGDLYYLDLETLEPTDFERTSDVTPGELSWEYR